MSVVANPPPNLQHLLLQQPSSSVSLPLPGWEGFRLDGKHQAGVSDSLRARKPSSLSASSSAVASGLSTPLAMSAASVAHSGVRSTSSLPHLAQHYQQVQQQPSPPDEPYRCEFPPPLAPRHWTVLKEVGDGSFGTVWLADWHSQLNVPPGTQPPGPSSRPEYKGKQLVAIKRMKKAFDGGWDECMKLKELKSLRELPMHPNIIPLYDAFLLPTTRELYFVFECMEGNLYQLTKSRKGRPLAAGLIASIFYQLLSGLHHMHIHGYFHRDLKPENLLITTTGLADYPASALYALPTAPPEKDVIVIVKLADFGLAREITSKPPYTEYVSTRWYRAPEVLLRSRDYSVPVDMWAVGTIMVEVLTLKPLFPGDSEVDQVYKICEVLGDPSTEYGYDDRGRLRGGGTWARGVKMAATVGFAFPKIPPRNLNGLFDLNVVSQQMIDCIADLLRYEPKARLTAQQCLEHAYFREVAYRFAPAAPAQTHHQLPTPANSHGSAPSPYNSSMSVNTHGLANPPSQASPRSLPPSHSHPTASHPAAFNLPYPANPNGQALPSPDHFSRQQPLTRNYSVSSAASGGSGLSGYPVQIQQTAPPSDQVPILGFPSPAPSVAWNGQGEGWGQLPGQNNGGLRPMQAMPNGRRPSLAPSVAASTYYDGSIFEGSAASRASSIMSFPVNYGGASSAATDNAAFAPSLRSPSLFSPLSPQQSRVDSIACSNGGGSVAGPSGHNAGLGMAYSPPSGSVHSMPGHQQHQHHPTPPQPDLSSSPQSTKSLSRWGSILNGSDSGKPNPLKRSPSNASIAGTGSNAPSPSAASLDPKKAKKEAEKLAKEQEKANRMAKEQAARERARAVMKKKNQLKEAADPLHNFASQSRPGAGAATTSAPLDKGKGRALPSDQMVRQRMPQIIEDTGRLNVSHAGGMVSQASLESVGGGVGPSGGGGSFLANRFKAKRRMEDDDDVHSVSSADTGHSSQAWPFPINSRGRTFSISSKATSASDPERRQHRGPDFPVTEMDPLARVSSISSVPGLSASGARTGGGGGGPSLHRFPSYGHAHGHYTAPSTGHSSLDAGFIGGMQGLATTSTSDLPLPYPHSHRSDSRQRLTSPHHERFSPYPRSPGPTLPPISSFDQQRRGSIAASIATHHSQPGVMPSYFVQPPGGEASGNGASGAGGAAYHLPHVAAMDQDPPEAPPPQHPFGSAHLGGGGQVGSNGDLTSPTSATFPYPSPSLSSANGNGTGGGQDQQMRMHLSPE